MKSNNPTRFVKDTTKYDPKQDEMFERMVQTISKIGKISPNVARLCGENAIKAWETQNKKDIINIFYMSNIERAMAVDELIGYLKDDISPYFNSDRKIERTLLEAQNSFGDIFIV